MKNFDDFKKTIDQETLNKWNDDVSAGLREKISEEFKDDPDAMEIARLNSYHLGMSLRLLEAYHNWLND